MPLILKDVKSEEEPMDMYTKPGAKKVGKYMHYFENLIMALMSKYWWYGIDPEVLFSSM